MDKLADWEVLPPNVISRVLWSEHLQLLDQLRCLEVCKNWNDVLRNNSGGRNRVHELSVQTEFLTGRPSLQRTALFPNEQPPAIFIDPTDLQAAPSDSYNACLQWLDLRSNLFGKVQLSISISAGSPHTWQLQEVLRTLQAVCLRAASVLEVELWTGESLSTASTPVFFLLHSIPPSVAGKCMHHALLSVSLQQVHVV